jgi:hypothetical protein
MDPDDVDHPAKSHRIFLMTGVFVVAVRPTPQRGVATAV